MYILDKRRELIGMISIILTSYQWQPNDHKTRLDMCSKIQSAFDDKYDEFFKNTLLINDIRVLDITEPADVINDRYVIGVSLNGDIPINLSYFLSDYLGASLIREKIIDDILS